MSAVVDWIPEGVTMVEERGAIISVKRPCYVSGLANTYKDPRTLQEALNDAGVPTFNSTLTGVANVVCTRREVEVLEPTRCRVICIYQAHAQSGLNKTSSGGSSLMQVSTRTDQIGQLITVSYGGDTQVANLSVLHPQSTLRARFVYATDYPFRISALWVGRLNAVRWADAAAGTWLCTNVEWELNDSSTSPVEYWFDFEFQNDLRGWQPKVYYQASDGTVPGDLVSGTGYKTVYWYPYKDFSELFPS